MGKYKVCVYAICKNEEQFADRWMDSMSEADHVVVPDRAVVKQPGSGNKYVYVLNPADNTVSYNHVELGRRIGNTYEVLSGVDNGAEVVIAGQTRLADGVKVDVVKK